MAGLLVYLAGPGRSNEHTDQRMITGSDAMTLFIPDGPLTRESALMLAAELDQPRRAHEVEVTSTNRRKLNELRRAGMQGAAAVKEATDVHNVWHCSLSLAAEEGEISDDKWAAISRRFVEEMGFDVEADPRSPARWVAIRHGVSTAGNDHVHLAVSTVREDGTKVDMWRDFTRAQQAATLLETEFGLAVTSGRAERQTTKGASPAQEQRRERTGSRETPRETLARTVRATAGAAESEAEFVRLVRANGLLIRPRYADGSRDTVTGYSVALATDAYATRNGAPVWHGGGKLGNDLSLPRLRETWIDDHGARADAVSAWSHNRRDPIATAEPVVPKRAAPKTAKTFQQARDELRVAVLKVAASARDEGDFVGNTLSNPALLIRPRFAPGSRTEVTGYSVALRPHLYARADGQPQWHGGGKLDDRLSLSALRERWDGVGNPDFAQRQWTRAAGVQTPQADQWGPAAAAAGRWSERIASVAPDASMGSWAMAAGDTAATVSAWAVRAEAGRPAELSRLADALADSAGHRRPAGGDARRGASAARRAAAMILAASHDDHMQAYRVMFAQIAAAARAIADAADARGHAQRAVAIRSALDDATRQHAAAVAAAPQPRRSSAAARSEPTRRPGAGREDGHGR